MKRVNSVTIENLCDIIEQSSILESKDTGSMIIHRLRHPVRGEVITIDSACSSEKLVISL